MSTTLKVKSSQGNQLPFQAVNKIDAETKVTPLGVTFITKEGTFVVTKQSLPYIMLADEPNTPTLGELIAQEGKKSLEIDFPEGSVTIESKNPTTRQSRKTGKDFESYEVHIGRWKKSDLIK